jgi:hypothetical protein
MSGAQRVLRAVLTRISADGDMPIRVHRLTLATVMAHAGLQADHIGEAERSFFEVEAMVLEPMCRAGLARRDVRIGS